jgi:hypothetical protein
VSKQTTLTEIGASAYKKLLLVSLVLSAIAIVGLSTTSWCPDNHPGFFAFSLSWVINVVIFGCTRDTFLKMNPMRFTFGRWEREGEIYRWIGLGVFRWLLLRTPLIWLSPTLKVTAHPSNGMERLLRELSCAEWVHRVGGVVTLGVACGYAVAGHVVVGLYFTLMTLVFHIYPVMLQRWNRGRVLRVARRLDSLAQSARHRHRCDPAVITEMMGEFGRDKVES